ncbi:hypothetical protein D3C87_1854970 [compost metagenome]
MKVKFIEFVLGHRIQDTEYLRFAMEITGDVQHKTTVWETRLIFYLGIREI